MIDAEQFEKEVEKQWRSLARNTSALGVQIGSAAAKGASNLGQRLGAAAKAAWSEFLTHRPNAKLPESAQDNLESSAKPASKSSESTDDAI